MASIESESILKSSLLMSCFEYQDDSIMNLLNINKDEKDNVTLTDMGKNSRVVELETTILQNLAQRPGFERSLLNVFFKKLVASPNFPPSMAREVVEKRLNAAREITASIEKHVQELLNKRLHVDEISGESSSEEDDEDDKETSAMSQRPERVFGQREDYLNLLIPPVQNAVLDAMASVRTLWESLDAIFNLQNEFNYFQATEKATSDVEVRNTFFSKIKGTFENYINLSMGDEDVEIAQERDATFLQIINAEIERSESLLHQEILMKNISAAGC